MTTGLLKCVPWLPRCVFAWGNFKVIKEQKRDLALEKLFKNPKVIAFNKNGSPKHPLYAPSIEQLAPYTTPKTQLSI